METKDYNASHKAIVTVVGTDQVGIIAKVSGFLATKDVNIEDISQTVLSGRFVMMMSVDLSKTSQSISVIKEELNTLGKSEHLSISMMHEDVFTEMNRI
ncbi:MAG: ACT domain-containing protein [Spirochaetaceae bacterium]|jgi:ACT domain-containing protein|nr:ACT domain-containing protein [Spirochaetaceae bacterium]